MKRKASVSHDEAIIRRLRKDPDFAAEYLKAALEDKDEPRVLLIALRHLTQAQGSQSRESCRHRARKPLSSFVRARQPSSIHAGRRHQGNRTKAPCRSHSVI